jgi:hypothetical protein
MEVLAAKQIRVLLDLIEEDAPLQPYISTLTGEQKQAIVFVLIHLKNGVLK